MAREMVCVVQRKGKGFGVKQTWVSILAALSMSCGTLDRSELHLTHLWLGLKPTLESLTMT